MLKRNNNLSEGTIEISKGSIIEIPTVPKIVVGPIIVANILMLATTSIPPKQALNGLGENIIIEQGNNVEDISYPTVQLRYENGKIYSSSKDEMINYLTPHLNEKEIEENTADIVFQQIVGDLRKENAILKEVLSKSFPLHTVVYLVVNSMVIVGAFLLLILRYVYHVYIVDPYYLICALLIALTLFLTALASMKDWKDFINER